MKNFNKTDSNAELTKSVMQKSADISKATPKLRIPTLKDLQAHPKNAEDVPVWYSRPAHRLVHPRADVAVL